jgi:hypothetical protein
MSLWVSFHGCNQSLNDSQAAALVVRGWRFHKATMARDLVPRAEGSALVVDAILWAALHVVILTSIPIRAWA